ncbi:MAG: N-acetyltransferase [Spirochaetes bacterium]|nr:MAG: N-acetyltransferase [Spirochaetota bacterium]
MNPTIRLSTPADFQETEFLTREAFWDIYKLGCDEHLLLRNLRQVPAFIAELDMVAIHEGKIIGNIVYSKASVVDDTGIAHEVLCMGPLSVLPSHQGKGVGSQLMRHSIACAKSMGYKAIIIFGNPAYYHRFGFENAQKYGISTSEGANFDAFMALELQENGLKGVRGKFHEDPVFKIDTTELEEFEKGFPYREKHVTDTQLKL